MILSGIAIHDANIRHDTYLRYRERMDRGLDMISGTPRRRNDRRDEESAQEFARTAISPRIRIRPFNTDQINPNSYNLRLSPTVLRYDLDRLEHGRDVYLDPARPNPTIEETIPEEGLIFRPGVLYLCSTIEYTESWNCVPCIEGRSSVARMGVTVHTSAGFGDVGFCGTWTLEVTVVHPVVLYPRLPIAQISFTTVSKEHENYTSNKYQGQTSPRSSRLYQDLKAPGGDNEQTD